MGGAHGQIWMLIVQIGSKVAAIPVEHVVETMRPLPIEPLAELPAFVLGLSIIRGVALPVIDGARLFGGSGDGARTRFVVLRVGQRQAAVLIDHVIGVRQIAESTLGALPSLTGTASGEMIDAIGRLDSALMLVLDAGRMLEAAEVTG
jgi:purine-binding chemotaxis protein CheW